MIHHDRAAALIAVLWIALLAGLVLLSVNRAATLNLSIASGELGAVQARWLARAGVEQALASLDDDKEDVDSPLDWWYEDPQSFRQIKLESGSFSVIAPADQRTPRVPRYGILDLNSRVDVNTASDKQLAAIPDIDPAVVDAVVDWRDDDENARPGGAERGYYQHLEHPYEPRNGPLQTHAEMLLIKGIDRKTFYGEDANGNGIVDNGEKEGDPATRAGLASWTAIGGYEPNTDGDGRRRININTADQSALKESLKFTDALAAGLIQQRSQSGGQFQNLMQLLNVRPQQGVPAAPSLGAEERVSQISIEWLARNLDRLTLKDDDRLPARINVNTAPREVLMTIQGMTEDAANSIIAFRGSSKGPFESLGVLITANVIDPNVFRAVAESLTVRSNVFKVTSVGTASSRIRRTVTAIIDRSATPPVLYWHESE